MMMSCMRTRILSAALLLIASVSLFGQNIVHKTWNQAAVSGKRYSHNAAGTPTAPTLSTPVADGSSAITVPISTQCICDTLTPQYKASSSGTWNSLSAISTSATTYQFVGLSAGTSYDMRMIAGANSLTANSSTVTASTTSAGSGSYFFAPDLAAVSALSDIFPGGAADLGNGVNTYDGGAATLVGNFSPSGNTGRSIRITYPNNEAGVELKVAPFPATKTLFIGKWEYYNDTNDANAPGASTSVGWAGYWPAGLKTSRTFTTSDFSTTAPNGTDGAVYQSEKLIYFAEYQGGVGGDWAEARGFGSANYYLDMDGYYTTPYRDPNLAGGGWSVSQNDTPYNISTGNTLPWIRAGQWYKYETFLQVNSAVNAADGIMRIWINDVLVFEKTNVVFASNSATRGPNGGDPAPVYGTNGWQSMWFGGNYSGSAGGFEHPGTPIYRYIARPVLSTSDMHASY